MQGKVQLLAEETAKAYGVNVSGLAPDAHTKVLVQCERCTEVFTREFVHANKPHSCPDLDPEDDSVPRVEVEIRNPDAIVPHRSRASDAGYDVHSLVDASINPGEVLDINTGLAMVAPVGYYFTVEGRSSMFRSGIVPFRGIIDGCYTGDLIVSLMNVGKSRYDIKSGDRVAQIVPHKIILMDIVEVRKISDRYNIRGNRGFGSSGK